MNFIQNVKEIAEEQGKSIQDMIAKQIVPANTFYQYKQRDPSLKTLINIANYLEVSIDYLLEFSMQNNYVPYCYDTNLFYYNVLNFLKLKGVSGRQFCKDLNYSKDNLNRWKNGTAPTLRRIIEIADYFDCSIDDLLVKK